MFMIGLSVFRYNGLSVAIPPLNPSTFQPFAKKIAAKDTGILTLLLFLSV